MGEQEWLSGLARECKCCPNCQALPCGGCQQGAPCDAMPCRCGESEEHYEAQGLDDLDAEGELP